MGHTPPRGLDEIQAELQSALKAKTKELDVLLRSVIASELEGERHQARGAELNAEHAALSEKAAAAKKASDMLEIRVEKIRSEAQAQEVHEQMLAQSIANLQAETSGAQARIQTMEAEHIALENEVKTLQERERLLSQNLVRLQNLKDDLGHTLSGLTAQMAEAGSAKQNS
jgi:chromosome segregation ATPase